MTITVEDDKLGFDRQTDKNSGILNKSIKKSLKIIFGYFSLD